MSEEPSNVAASGKVAKKQKKEDKKLGKKKEISIEELSAFVATLPSSTVKLFTSDDANSNLKCALVAALCKIDVVCLPGQFTKAIALPSLQHEAFIAFGANSVCRYLGKSLLYPAASDSAIEDIINFEEFTLTPLMQQDDRDALAAALTRLESRSTVVANSPFLSALLTSSLTLALPLASSQASWEEVQGYPGLKAVIQSSQGSLLSSAQTLLTRSPLDAVPSTNTSNTSSKDDGSSVKAPAVVPIDPSLLADWRSTGMMACLKNIFSLAITAAFPHLVSHANSANLCEASIARCANSSHGDFQVNNAMGVSRVIKGDPALLAIYGKELCSPRAVADRILSSLAPLTAANHPLLPWISSHPPSSTPQGFVNITLSSQLLAGYAVMGIVQADGPLPLLAAEGARKKKVLIDFSSPNIAKEMHVGHLRSTIIGDCLARVCEYLGHDTMRVNHVGDWGTQFGMLIAHFNEEEAKQKEKEKEKEKEGRTGGAEEYSAPSITDLTSLYKAAKGRFDTDPVFKEQSRLSVVSLQSGDTRARQIWHALCDVSRSEFQKVYDALNVKLVEVGESYYNPMIPSVIDYLRDERSLVTRDQGMDIIKLFDWTVPLILRKSDGGYGYDSTDMAAVRHRLVTLDRDWVIVITDAGQANHFDMVYEVARHVGWDSYYPASDKKKRLDHIGFGVVCGPDGKRFKTRSGDTVRLMDLLDAAKEKMLEALIARQQQSSEEITSTTGSSNKKVGLVMTEEELLTAARNIGYGAVKYFDLKQHPRTDYIFSYDAMLNTKGDTAVYLMFAYARLASILRKAGDEKGIATEQLKALSISSLSLIAPEERALAMQLLLFNDTIVNALSELLPNRICDYLHELAVTFTDFVTKCHVLQSLEGEDREEKKKVMESRLVLCEATKRVMAKAFDLLGITPCDRI